MKKLFALGVVCLFSVLCPLFVGAQAPSLINYQGRLLSGTNLVNGNVGLSLRIFGVASGGTRLYEDSNTVTVVDGLYSTVIGDNTTYGNFFGTLANTQLWIEVAVNNTALTPRERLASVAYAQRVAGIAISTNGLPAVTFIPEQNTIFDESSGSVIGGGWANSISNNSSRATIGGGYFNSIGAGSYGAIIAGGGINSVSSDSYDSVISGGFNNLISLSSPHSSIGGGHLNAIGRNAQGARIGGGSYNNLYSNSTAAVIGGGAGNAIFWRSPNTVIGGGGVNIIWYDVTNATISGGTANEIRPGAISATIGGGEKNVISNMASYSTIAGGFLQSIGASAFYSFLGGGYQNAAGSNAWYSSIGGGFQNAIDENVSAATIGGGFQNFVFSNANQAAIGGGADNIVGRDANQATVPGGFRNEASGTRSFAAGNYAKATNDGAFVWSDNSAASAFRSTSNNQFLVRAQGGVGINTNRPGAALHVAGEAMIGSVANPARFGMTAVFRNTTGNLFVHPADTNLVLTWDAGVRALTITNTSPFYYDCQMQVIREENYSPVVNSRDIANSASVTNFLRLTNSAVQNAGWSATAVQENQTGPGFQFNGSGYSGGISGLITYWY